MKNLYTFLIAAVMTATSLQARIVTSVSNGNATMPLTWSCLCVPMDGDTIIINHAVVLDVDYAFTMGGIQINSGGSLTGNSATRIFGVSGGYFVNDGTLSMGYVGHNGGAFTNNSNMTVTSFLIDQGVSTNNYGTITVGDTTYINTNSTLFNYGTCHAGTVLNAGTIATTQVFDAGDILSTGVFSGNAPVVSTGSVYNTGNFGMLASLTVSGDIWNAENFSTTGLVSAQTFYNGDTINGTAFLTNNGTISLSNSFFNSEDISGSGSFCVVDSTINSGTVSGSVDICDLSGSTWDLNIGTEAGTVTHCSNGPCTIGIVETSSSVIGISPNPSNEIIKLQLPRSEAGVVQVIDITGRVVMTEEIAGKEMLLNVLQLPEGMYSVTIIGATQNYTGRFVKE